MEEKILSEFKISLKEWGRSTYNVFHQIDKELWVKGRITVGFGIVVVCLLGSIAHHRDRNHERSFDRDCRGSMMQDRKWMMQNFKNSKNKKGRFSNQQEIQGCSQQANFQVDGQTPNIKIMRSNGNYPSIDQEAAEQINQSDFMFDRMESRMKQIFGNDNKWSQTTIEVPIPTINSTL